MIGGNPVFEGMGTAGVLCHIAADRAGLLAGRIRRVIVPLGRHGLGDPEIDDARLDDRPLVVEIDFQDAIELRQGDHHAALDRQGPAAQAGPSPTGDKGDLCLIGKADDFRHLRCRGGKDHHLWHGLEHGEPIALIDELFFWLGQDIGGSYKAL